MRHLILTWGQETTSGRLELGGDVCRGDETIVADLYESGRQDV